MPAAHRRTIITFGRLAMRKLRLEAARKGVLGLQIMSIEQLAARLAGGFLLPIDKDRLRDAIRTVLPRTDLGELESIKELPGFVRASADTLSKAWLSGIDLKARSAEHPRIAAIASLEQAILEELPANLLRPFDLANKAIARIEHAGAIFGDIEINGLTELSPCWRGLLQAVGTHTAVEWVAGPRKVPDWLDDSSIHIQESAPETPAKSCVSAATAYHEAIEAVRWARELIASGKAKPQEIAIAATATADYDDHLLALGADANLDIHFAHGVNLAASRDGQAAAALADVLLRGLSQTRFRRLASILSRYPGPFEALPEGWIGVLPSEAPLTSLNAWTNLINGLSPEDWPDQNDQGKHLLELIEILDQGKDRAAEIGDALLKGLPLSIWRRALLLGPPASLELSLETLRTDDSLDPNNSIIWAPASSLAAAPRPYVYLLGLNSGRWPHVAFEDRLLSDHIIPTTDLEPLPINLADTRDFETILATTASEVVLSRARRDSEGRRLGRSALLQGYPEEKYLRRNRVPEHAFSEADRLIARQEEFQTLPQAKSAHTCWRNWHRYDEITPHDGLIRSDHPVVHKILANTQSASSLRLLLRNPLGFVWRYGLGLRFSDTGEDPLTLDALAMGDLVHETLERALRALEGNAGFANSGESEITSAISDAIAKVAEKWEFERPIPPKSVWQQTLEDARDLSGVALLRKRDEALTRAYAEVPFGSAKSKSDAPLPWDQESTVEIPQTGFRISGYIDRLDLSEDDQRASVRDYKTGKPPKVTDARPFILDGGKELQRCLYAYAVKAMLGEDTQIQAALHYLRGDVELALEDPENTMEDLGGYLQFAIENFVRGGCTIGEGSGETYDDFAFALPANAANIYCKRKKAAALECVREAAEIWGAD